MADGFNGFVVHLANHDVSLCAVSLAPLAKLQGYKQRMGWIFPWASSYDSDFNYDFHAAITEEEQQSGEVEYNFRASDWRPDPNADDGADASPVGTDLATYSRQMPGMTSFVRHGEPSTTSTRPTPGASTYCGAPISGSTGHHWVETRLISGGAATTNTSPNDDPPISRACISVTAPTRGSRRLAATPIPWKAMGWLHGLWPEERRARYANRWVRTRVCALLQDRPGNRRHGAVPLRRQGTFSYLVGPGCPRQNRSLLGMTLRQRLRDRRPRRPANGRGLLVVERPPSSLGSTTV